MQLFLLGFDHLGGDAVGAKDRFKQALLGQHGLWSEKVRLALFRRQVIHGFFDHRAQNALLFVDRGAQIRREEGQKQFFVGIVVDNRGWIDALSSTDRALEVVGGSREQLLLGFRIGIGIE